MHPSYEKYKAYIQFFSSNALENTTLQMYMNKPEHPKIINYHRDEILKNMLIDSELQEEVKSELTNTINLMKEQNQQLEK